MAGMRHEPEGGVVPLLAEVADGVGRLVQGELRLARAEMTAHAKAAGAGIAQVAVAAVFGLVGLNVLAGAAVAGLAQAGLGPFWAALVVGLGLLLVALGLAVTGWAAVKLGARWPGRAFRGLRRDADAVASGLASKGVGHV